VTKRELMNNDGDLSRSGPQEQTHTPVFWYKYNYEQLPAPSFHGPISHGRGEIHIKFALRVRHGIG
jgi:hypothetical protein